MTEDSAVSFTSFRLARPVVRALTEMGIEVPTPIQAHSIGQILKGEDICASAITGSGKSAAFLVPIVHKLISYRGHPGPKALILSPTRELAQQLHSVFEQISKYAKVTCGLVIGGVSAEEQAAALTPSPDVIIATPGRIIDAVFNSKILTMDHIQFFVMDEADRLLGRGFEAELYTITNSLPDPHQTLLFTATMSDSVQRVANKLQKNPIRVNVDPFLELSPKLRQEFVKVKEEERRLPYLIALIQNLCREKTIVFFPTKLLAHQVYLLFKYIGITAAELHADLPQPTRTAAIESFAKNDVRVLLASDLAARGIDIPDVNFVINYTVPSDIERYIHRVGRTARAGKTGTAISFIHTADEKKIKKKISKHAAGEIVQRKITGPLLEKAISAHNKYKEKIAKDIEAEEAERIKRAEAAAEKRMKAMLDVEEEIPAAPPAEPKKRNKRH